MLDGVTGLLMLVGLWSLARRHWREMGWVVVLLLGVGWLAGLLSISQEGAPYVYRSAGVMLPAFLMVGFGVQAIDRALGPGTGPRASRWAWYRYVVPALCGVALLWNWHLYFGLESRSALAARVMAYEIRLIVDEVRATRLPVYLVGADTLMKRRILDRPGRSPLRYLDRNPTFQFSAGYSLRAVEYLSGRRQESAVAGDPGVGVELLDPGGFESAAIAKPAVVIFRPGGQGEAKVRARFPDARVRYVEDVRGPRALGVVDISAVESAARRFH